MRGKARFLLFLFTPGGEYTSIFLLIIIIPKMKDTIYEENRLPEGRMPALRVEPMPADTNQHGDVFGGEPLYRDACRQQPDF